MILQCNNIIEKPNCLHNEIFLQWHILLVNKWCWTHLHLHVTFLLCCREKWQHLTRVTSLQSGSISKALNSLKNSLLTLKYHIVRAACENLCVSCAFILSYSPSFLSHNPHRQGQAPVNFHNIPFVKDWLSMQWVSHQPVTYLIHI